MSDGIYASAFPKTPFTAPETTRTAKQVHVIDCSPELDAALFASRKEQARLAAELETTAAKLSDCWEYLDFLARGKWDVSPAVREDAAMFLREQQAPGWKWHDIHDGLVRA